MAVVRARVATAAAARVRAAEVKERAVAVRAAEGSVVTEAR